MNYSSIKLAKATILFLSFFSFSACIKEIEVDDVLVNPELVINSLFKDGNVLYIQIAQSRSIIRDDNPDEFIFPSDAEITIYENDIELESDISFDDNIYTLSSLNMRHDSIYRIAVLLPGYDPVTAESKIPAPVKIDSIQIRRVYKTDPELNEISDDILTGSIYFNDKDEENYYMLRLEAVDYLHGNEDFDPNNDFFRSPDPIAIDANYQPQEIRALIFKDNLFNGGICDLDFEIDDSNGDKDSTVLVCKLYSLSKDFYQYMITYSGQYASDFSLMSEPINLYSNIENGLGIFAGYSLDTLSIAIE